MTTTHLECSECNKKFEVSTITAASMHQWREASGEPFLCVDCATQISWGEAISAKENRPSVGANCARDL